MQTDGIALPVSLRCFRGQLVWIGLGSGRQQPPAEADSGPLMSHLAQLPGVEGAEGRGVWCRSSSLETAMTAIFSYAGGKR